MLHVGGLMALQLEISGYWPWIPCDGQPAQTWPVVEVQWYSHHMTALTNRKKDRLQPAASDCGML